MSIPEPLDTAAAREALEYFHAAGFDEIDTAILYQDGATETTLGEIGVEKFRVAAKANPWYKTDESHDFFTPTYGLRPDLVKEQLRKSIEVLGVPSVELFYLHAPDHNTPIEGTLQAVHELRSEGLFREWGLSNYTAWETVDIWHICKANGWQTPVVYQGMYNAVTREVERELLPALKKLGMRFYAYNPLVKAGGLLSGKHKFEKPPEDGRFSTTSLWGSLYRARYWRKELFDEIEKLKAICVKHDTDLVSASFRWMRHHSSLTGKAFSLRQTTPFCRLIRRVEDRYPWQKGGHAVLSVAQVLCRRWTYDIQRYTIENSVCIETHPVAVICTCRSRRHNFTQ
ncbi:unnamed protein product [Ectocarpus sp. 4 AP-2014]